MLRSPREARSTIALPARPYPRRDRQLVQFALDVAAWPPKTLGPGVVGQRLTGRDAGRDGQVAPQTAGEIAGLGLGAAVRGRDECGVRGPVRPDGQFVELLRGQGVDGAVVATAEQAQLASDAAAAAWARADQVLTPYGQVGDAYAANPAPNPRSSTPPRAPRARLP